MNCCNFYKEGKTIPIYEFQCGVCGLLFDKSVSFAKRDQEQKCTCGAKVFRKRLESLSYVFDHEVSGMVPQNTGITAIDMNVDRVIGKDSSAKWSQIEKRVNLKRQILENNPEIQGKDLSRELDGSYRVMTPQEKQASDAARNLHNEAMARIQKHIEMQKK